MTGQTLSQVERAIDGRHPVRSVFRLLGLHRRRVLAAVGFFALKDSPQWLMPVVTAGHRRRRRRRAPQRARVLGGIAFIALAQNYPKHVL